MSKLLVIFGATGNQGSSVINTVLSTPSLHSQYRIRAVTRDPAQPSAQAFKGKGIEVVRADLSEPASLAPALAGAHTVFALTTSPLVSNLAETEFAQGKLLADSVVAAKAEYLIFSSLTPCLDLYGRKVEMFDGKAAIETYIRSLPIKSAFFWPGVFMQNWLGLSRPRRSTELGKEGNWVTANMISPDAKVALIDIAADTGKCTAPILAEPGKYEGKVMWGASGLWTYQEVAEAIAKATGEKVSYVQLPGEVFVQNLPEVMRGHYADMIGFTGEVGCFGKETEKKVEWTHAQMAEKPTGLEEFLKRVEYKLE